MSLTPYVLALVLVAAVASQSVDLSTRSNTAAPEKNLFKEYVTRGLYSCASNYVQTLTKLHHLIKEAAEEHRKCSDRLAKAPQTYEPTEFAHFNDLLEEYRKDDNSARHARHVRHH
uniref:Secreted protein n=1 Tax=Steinernema glaseri TaxID=37863 RepID=A0A1I7YUJ8_9BILA